jgi:hypothetical protein
MTTLMDFDFPHDYHCHPAASGTSEYPKKGGRGVTIWGPRTTDIHLPATGVPCDPLKFTCTQPQCYIGDDNCNVTFTIHTAAWSQQKSIVGDITMELVNNVTGARASTKRYHSGVGGHDLTETHDISKGNFAGVYSDSRLMRPAR